MKKHQRNSLNQSENVFSQSTGDLMAGLLFIFILFLMITILQLTNQKENFKTKSEEVKNLTDTNMVAVEKYENNRNEIREILGKIINNESTELNAVLDTNLLCIRFMDEKSSIQFESGKYDISNSFKKKLECFFPTLIDSLYQDNLWDKIKGIKIEGHTDSTNFKGVADNDSNYVYNMELSQKRATEVLKYCLNVLDSKTKRDDIKQKITANGLSFSKPLKNKSDEIDLEISRRVEFCVEPNAEKYLQDIFQKSKAIKQKIEEIDGSISTKN